MTAERKKTEQENLLLIYNNFSSASLKRKTRVMLNDRITDNLNLSRLNVKEL